jgi:hypothetical protein
MEAMGLRCCGSSPAYNPDLARTVRKLTENPLMRVGENALQQGKVIT